LSACVNATSLATNRELAVPIGLEGMIVNRIG
jgi:hypothetical protein